jgi:hypothetical protein
VRAIITVLTLLLATPSISVGETCRDRAQICVNKWGNPKAACYDEFRISACEKTGRYIAPNGNIWPAARVSKGEKG